jgi:uncharacterized protein YegP (UPF0339 family)
MAGKFVLKKTANGQFDFRLVAGNGEQILRSETYTTKPAAENGIESVKKNAGSDVRYEKLTAKNGQFYFNLKAANGQVIGTSEMYKAEASREKGIASVKTNAATAAIDDQA